MAWGRHDRSQEDGDLCRPCRCSRHRLRLVVSSSYIGKRDKCCCAMDCPVIASERPVLAPVSPVYRFSSSVRHQLTSCLHVCLNPPLSRISYCPQYTSFFPAISLSALGPLCGGLIDLVLLDRSLFPFNYPRTEGRVALLNRQPFFFCFVSCLTSPQLRWGPRGPWAWSRCASKYLTKLRMHNEIEVDRHQ